MEQYNTVLDAILSNLNQSYQLLNEFNNSTMEMDRLTTEGDDLASFGIYVDMRDNNITRLSKLNEDMQALLKKLPEEIAFEVKQALSKSKPTQIEDPAIARLAEADARNRELHARIVATDQALNMKIGGMKPPPTEEQEQVAGEQAKPE